MFTNSQNVKVDNSQFTSVTNNHIVTRSTESGIDILLEASAPGAAYDSSVRDPPPRCFPGTRREFVEDILHWAVPPFGNTPPPVYQMKGPAGVGKSAVMQTCVESLTRLNKRCPAFFFSINGQSKHQKFFPSIAYQLATIYPDYHDLVDKKIHRNKTLIDKTMEAQFWGLIVEPLQELEKTGKGIGKRIPVFVDGLDECESQDAQCEIIEIVAAAARDGAAPLCWAFSSRPEPHIEATFSQANISPLCHMTILPISRSADGDIELYLRAGFGNILRRRNITTRSQWPSPSDMKVLVRAAAGLFIFAKTVLRFVGLSGSLNHEELLHAIIAVILSSDQHSTSVGPAFVELDTFYKLIMQRISAEMLLPVRLFLATLCWSYSSSAMVVANTLELSRVELETICHQLNSVVHFQSQEKPLKLDPTTNINCSFLYVNPTHMAEACKLVRYSLGGSISFYHKSFRDFLIDPLRSGVYCINTTAINNLINEGKWKLALRFAESHRWQGSELVRIPGAPLSMSKLSYPYTNELVSSLVEAWIYRCVDIQSTPFGADFDFRKHFSVSARITTGLSESKPVSRPRLYQCAGFRKYIRGTALAWLQPGEFSRFSVTAFKEDIERQKEKDIIRPYHIPSDFLDVPQRQVESGLYVMGHGSKSIFWFWEIDYHLKSFQQFHTIDLVEGQKIYKEEQLKW